MASIGRRCLIEAFLKLDELNWILRPYYFYEESA